MKCKECGAEKPERIDNIWKMEQVLGTMFSEHREIYDKMENALIPHFNSLLEKMHNLNKRIGMLEKNEYR